ncbi:MAG: membrane dipeptidase [Cyclobacteriaceae bacterium]|nr:membrane dipeptidase [Cyclobacteriaceae bacterium]
MKFFSVLCLSLSLLFLSCSEKKPAERMNDEQLHALADSLAHKFIIMDGHVDLPFRLKIKNFRVEREYMGIPISYPEGDFDYERAVKGGLSAPFMSIYVPSSYQLLPDKGKAVADSMINMVIGITTNIPDKFALANTVADVEKNFKEGKISLPMGMENAAPFGNDLKNVKYFYDRGVRYATLTHSKDNQICDSSGDTTRTWGGLSPFGIEVVKEMNRIGMIVDISHVDDSTFYQVMKLSKAPCIASHSSARFFAPTVRRDMTDDMIKKLGENDGVMDINFYTAFLSSEVSRHNKKLDSLLKSKGLDSEDSLAKPVIAEYLKDHPTPPTDVQTVANHIDHAVKLAGIDHVGLGSDYDGVGGATNLPSGLKDVSQYPNLIYELLKRGYTESDIEKICSGNFIRVWKKVEEIAKK